ncbi:MAG: SDR family oxidoreductase [Williamsia sp.]|nr:SDR family oxidoreductase [Williamsia sp.]
MELSIKEKLFIVGGATSGFGGAIVDALLAEGAQVIAVARGEEKLRELESKSAGQVYPVCADVTKPESIEKIRLAIGDKQVHGLVVNAGGPPAMSALEARLEDWDEAYRTVVRWKIDLISNLLPAMIHQGYGRVLFIESASVKQPIENLALSNAMRLAVVGYAKTLSQEVARKGITLNVLAPGSHATRAINRVIQKRAEQTGVSIEEARKQQVNQIGVGFFGEAADLAALALWLLSPQSRFITGQTISVDGGTIKGIMG